MNPTRSLLYTVNYLQHLVTQYSFELSHWQPRSEQWQSHQPLQSHELLLPHFFSGWMSPAYVHTTALFWCCLQKQEFTLKGRHQFYCWQRSRFTNNIPTPSPFFFFFILLFKPENDQMIRQKICPKSASVQSYLGREQALCQAENSRSEEVRAS